MKNNFYILIISTLLSMSPVTFADDIVINGAIGGAIGGLLLIPVKMKIIIIIKSTIIIIQVDFVRLDRPKKVDVSYDACLKPRMNPRFLLESNGSYF